MPNTQESIESMGGIPEISMEVAVSGMTQTAVDKSLSITDMAADAKATGDAISTAMADIADLAADIAIVAGKAYPVGSVFMTIENSLPSDISAVGTWVEIGITATWAQLKTGKRGYLELDSGDVGGTLHFWLRTA